MIGVLITLVSGLLLALGILSQIEVWQRKEYRLDRMLAYLRERDTFRTTLLPYLMACALTDVGWLALFADRVVLAQWVGWVLLGGWVLYFGWRSLQRGIFRPVVTVKALINVVVLGGAVGFHVLLRYPSELLGALEWSTLLLLLPALAVVTVMMVNIPAVLRKRHIIATAARRRAALTALTAVGITGSYGKSSVKHFVHQILEHAHVEHAVTAEHRNSELAVAQDMLQRLTPAVSVYVAEMGAYRPGEIAALARLVRPRVGVVTALGNQHVALFGSLERLIEAKWELPAALPSDGVAILNADDSVIVTRAARGVPGRVLWYSAQTSADVWAEHTDIEPTHLDVLLHIGSQREHLHVPLLGAGALSSVLAAAATAVALDIPAATIFAAVRTLTPMPRTMELRQGQQGATVIDDGYSANEHGVINAVRQLQRFPQPHKVVVLPPLIELGAQAEAVHERIGAALAEQAMTVYLAGSAYAAALQRGGLSAERLHVVPRPQALARALAHELRTETVVLLAGRLPTLVRQAVLA